MPKKAATLAAAARSGLSGSPTQKEWRRGKNFSSEFLSVFLITSNRISIIVIESRRLE